MITQEYIFNEKKLCDIISLEIVWFMLQIS